MCARSKHIVTVALSRGSMLKQNTETFLNSLQLLWPPCIADADIIFLPCGYYLLSFFLAYNLCRRGLDVFHTSTHGVALVRI